MFVFIWIVMALVVAVVASGKGRSGVGWFFYGLLLWPVALAHICVIRRPEPARAEAPTAAPEAPPVALPPPDDLRARVLSDPGAGKAWVRRSKFALPLRGITKDNADGTPRQELIAELRPGDALAIVPEPDNPFDRFALKFMTVDSRGVASACVGYVPAERAEEFAKRQAAGTGLQAIVERIERVDGAEPFLAPRVRFELWESVAATDAGFALAELPDVPPPQPAWRAWFEPPYRDDTLKTLAVVATMIVVLVWFVAAGL